MFKKFREDRKNKKEEENRKELIALIEINKRIDEEIVEKEKEINSLSNKAVQDPNSHNQIAILMKSNEVIKIRNMRRISALQNK